MKPRWHDLIIGLVIAGIAAWGVFALWGDAIGAWVDGEQATEERAPGLPGVRQTPL